MSVDRNVHFGYFLKCQNEMIETVEKPSCQLSVKIKSCPIDKLSPSQLPKTCDECSKVLSMVETKTRKVDYIDSEEIDEKFYSADCYGGNFNQRLKVFYDFFIPNFHDKDFEQNLSTVGSGDDEITMLHVDFNIKKETEDFANKHREIIDIFKSKYGEDNVEVCFGMIRYSS